MRPCARQGASVEQWAVSVIALETYSTLHLRKVWDRDIFCMCVCSLSVSQVHPVFS